MKVTVTYRKNIGKEEQSRVEDEVMSLIEQSTRINPMDQVMKYLTNQGPITVMKRWEPFWGWIDMITFLRE